MLLCYWLYDREFGGMVTILRVTVNKFETETVNEYVLILLYQC